MELDFCLIWMLWHGLVFLSDPLAYPLIYCFLAFEWVSAFVTRNILCSRNRWRSRPPENINSIALVVLVSKLMRSNHNDEINTHHLIINNRSKLMMMRDSRVHCCTLLRKPGAKKVELFWLFPSYGNNATSDEKGQTIINDVRAGVISQISDL